MKKIHCLSPDFRPPSKLLPITIAYRFKWITGLQLLQRKARGALRGDLMIPYVHLDPNDLAAPMASSSTVRILFSLKDELNRCLEHFNIASAFLYEAFGYSKTVYVKEMRRSDGAYRHGNTNGILSGNMYGGRSAGNYFIKGLIAWIKSKRYSPTDFDPCLYYKSIGDQFVIFSVYIDDFLVVSTKTGMIDNLFNEPQEKYSIKRIGSLNKYLGWSVHHELMVRSSLTNPIRWKCYCAKQEWIDVTLFALRFPKMRDVTPPTEDDITSMDFQLEYHW